MNMLDQWVELIQPFGFSERFVRWSFLTSISSLLENRCYLMDHGGGYLYPTLYTLLVGAPATFKTTTCDRVVEDLLRPLMTGTEVPFMGPNIASPAGLIRAFVRHNKKNIANDFKSSPMFIYAPEWQQFYADIGGGELIRDLLSFFDPKPPGVALTKEIVKEASQFEIVSPALTILGCATQKAIMDTKMMIHASNGIVSRFLFVHETIRPRGCRQLVDIKTSTVLKELQVRCQVLRALRGPFTLTKEASNRLSDLMSLNAEWFAQNQSETLFSQYMARRMTHLKKISMLLSVCEGTSQEITLAHITQADLMLRDIEPNMTKAFGMTAIKGDPHLLAKILDKITPMGVTEQTILQRFIADGQAVPADHEYSGAVDGLYRAGLIRVEKKKDGTIIYKRRDENENERT